MFSRNCILERPIAKYEKHRNYLIKKINLRPRTKWHLLKAFEETPHGHILKGGSQVYQENVNVESTVKDLNQLITGSKKHTHRNN